MGLYDNYRLSNSTVIPQYVGVPIAELSKLYEYNQNRYDIASQVDAQMADNVLNTPFLKQDEGTWKGINDQVQQEFQDRVAKGDYENLYGIVQQRARTVAAKIKPLVEQVKAKQDYQTQLDSKDFGLTPDQKATYMQMADDAYKGIKFDGQGRAIGGFRGMTPVKNVDVNETIRKALSILHEYSGKNLRKTDNGWQVQETSGEWKEIPKQVIMDTFNYARQNDKDWQVHNEQDLMLKQYAANRGVDDNVAMQSINALPDTITGADNKGKAVKVPNNIKTKLLTEIKAGKSPSAVMQKYNNELIASQQYNSQLGYAMGKYYREESHSSKSEIGDLAKAQYKAQLDFEYAKRLDDYKRQQDKLEDTEVVEGTVTDPSGDYKDWDSFQKDVRETDGAIDQTQTAITAQKQSIAKSLGITPDKLTDAQITAYFTKNKQPEAQAAYEDRVASLKNLQQRKANQQSIMGSLENDVLGTGEFGYTTSTARRTAEKDAVSKILLEKPNSNVRVNVGNYNRTDQKVGSDGKPLSANWEVMTRAQLVEKLKDAKIVATDKSWGINQVRFQLPDGRYVSLQDNAVTGKIDDIVSELGNKGKKLEQAKIDWFNKNHSNYAQSQSIQILSKKRSEQSKQEIIAAGTTTTNIQTIAGTPVEDEKVAMTIAGGNFQYIGRTKGNGRQNTGGIIAIIDPETKQVTGQYKVNYNTTSALPNAENLMKVGKKRNDASIYNTGMEMMPGNQVQAFDQKHVANVIIKDGNGNIIAKVEKTRPGGQTTIRIRDANGNRITTIPETSIDAKAFIQHQLENGATVEGLDN